MTILAAPARFSRMTIALHWLTLLLIVSVYATMELRGLFPRGSAPRDLMKLTHFSLGITILLLVAVRLAARFGRATPPIDPAPPRWQQRLAAVVHLALYAFMIGMPLAGWAILAGEGKAILFFGLELPAVIPRSEAIADAAEELHEAGAAIGYWLIGLHAAAALIHHYVMRDNTLRRMLLPARSDAA